MGFLIYLFFEYLGHTKISANGHNGRQGAGLEHRTLLSNKKNKLRILNFEFADELIDSAIIDSVGWVERIIPKRFRFQLTVPNF